MGEFKTPAGLRIVRKKIKELKELVKPDRTEELITFTL